MKLIACASTDLYRMFLFLLPPFRCTYAVLSLYVLWCMRAQTLVYFKDFCIFISLFYTNYFDANAPIEVRSDQKKKKKWLHLMVSTMLAKKNMDFDDGSNSYPLQFRVQGNCSADVVNKRLRQSPCLCVYGNIVHTFTKPPRRRRKKKKRRKKRTNRLQH